MHVSSARGKTASRLGSRPRGESSECACHSLAGRSTGTTAAATSHDAPPQASTRPDHGRQQTRESDAGVRVVSALWCSEQQCGGATIPGAVAVLGGIWLLSTPPAAAETTDAPLPPLAASALPPPARSMPNVSASRPNPVANCTLQMDCLSRTLTDKEGNAIKTDFPLRDFAGINSRARPPLAL